MAIDVVLPDGNEDEFIEIAEKLGYDSLIFLYPLAKFKKRKKPKKTKINIFPAVLFDKNNMKKFRSISGSSLAFIRVSNEDPRTYFDNKRVDIIYNPEQSRNKDFMHQRASGFNQIFAKLAAQNRICIGFSLDMLLNNKGASLARIFGRIKQNIVLCRKYKPKMVLASFAGSPYGMRSPHDLISLGVTLGMHPKEAQDSLNNLELKINHNLKKRKDETAEGVESLS